MEYNNSTFDEIMNSLFETDDNVSLKEKFSIEEIRSISRNPEFFSFPSYFTNDVLNVIEKGYY